MYGGSRVGLAIKIMLTADICGHAHAAKLRPWWPVICRTLRTWARDGHMGSAPDDGGAGEGKGSAVQVGPTAQRQSSVVDSVKLGVAPCRMDRWS